ncbi:MAG: triose-phosphate isomerase, partial [Ruminococcus sp.]|nr:triose-phosphate isomerase [Ruminococcus sp.]
FYGGEISPQQLTQLLKKQIIDGVFVDGDKMTSDGFISLIDTVQAAF